MISQLCGWSGFFLFCSALFPSLSLVDTCTLFASYLTVSITHSYTLFAYYVIVNIPLFWIFIQVRMNYKDLLSLSIFNQTWWKSVSWRDMGKITVNTSPVVPVNKCDSEGEFFMTMKSLPTARWKLFSTPAEPLVFSHVWMHSKFRNVQCLSKNAHSEGSPCSEEIRFIARLVSQRYLQVTANF